MKDRKSQYEKENNKRQEGENLPSPGRNEIEDSNHGFLKTEVFHFGHTLKPPEIKKKQTITQFPCVNSDLTSLDRVWVYNKNFPCDSNVQSG